MPLAELSDQWPIVVAPEKGLQIAGSSQNLIELQAGEQGCRMT